ncbi:42475_t:CDS:2, partial [Gigaspora margarita]
EIYECKYNDDGSNIATPLDEIYECEYDNDGSLVITSEALIYTYVVSKNKNFHSPEARYQEVEITENDHNKLNPKETITTTTELNAWNVCFSHDFSQPQLQNMDHHYATLSEFCGKCNRWGTHFESQCRDDNEINENYITKPIFDSMNYSEYIPDHLPLIISIPHSGQLFLPEYPIEKKNHPSVVKSNDLNTQEIGRELADKMMLHFKGKRPYLITLEETAIKYVESNFDLSAETLSLSTSQINENPEIYSGSSIRALYNRKLNSILFSDLLYSKTTSLGGHLQSYGYWLAFFFYKLIKFMSSMFENKMVSN